MTKKLFELSDIRPDHPSNQVRNGVTLQQVKDNAIKIKLIADELTLITKQAIERRKAGKQ